MRKREDFTFRVAPNHLIGYSTDEIRKIKTGSIKTKKIVSDPQADTYL